MTPSKLDLEIWRGATFRRELVTQTKTFIYNPAVHTSAVDLKRSHEENLEFYGANFAYVDFLSTYVSAELAIVKAWDKLEQNTPLLILDDLVNNLILGAKSITIVIDDATTQLLNFDSGSYKLRLTKANGDVDLFTYGSVTVFGG